MSISRMQQAEQFVRRYLSNLPTQVCFHNLDHTLAVKQAAVQIAAGHGLHSQEKQCLQLACLFHDVGYVRTYTDHELASAQVARAYLSQQNYGRATILGVERLILATHFPHQPQSLLEKIICDADLVHLASTDYFAISERLRQEQSWMQHRHMSETDWLWENLQFFASHHYFTPYGQRELAPRKAQNLALLQQKWGQVSAQE